MHLHISSVFLYHVAFSYAPQSDVRQPFRFRVNNRLFLGLIVVTLLIIILKAPVLNKNQPLSVTQIQTMLEPGGINHSESSRNNQSELIRNSQCTCLADRLPTAIQRDR